MRTQGEVSRAHPPPGLIPAQPRSGQPELALPLLQHLLGAIPVRLAHFHEHPRLPVMPRGLAQALHHPPIGDSRRAALPALRRARSELRDDAAEAGRELGGEERGARGGRGVGGDGSSELGGERYGGAEAGDAEVRERGRGGGERAEGEQPVRAAVPREAEAAQGGQVRVRAREGVHPAHGERAHARERRREHACEQLRRRVRHARVHRERLERRRGAQEHALQELARGVVGGGERGVGRGRLGARAERDVAQEEVPDAPEVRRERREARLEGGELGGPADDERLVEVRLDDLVEIVRDEGERAGGGAIVDAGIFKYLCVQLDRERVHRRLLRSVAGARADVVCDGRRGDPERRGPAAYVGWGHLECRAGECTRSRAGLRESPAN